MKDIDFEDILKFIRTLYHSDTEVLLHAPRFRGNEKKYLGDCIDSTYVSYVGKYVTDFEEHIKRVTGAKNAIAMVNGTAALQISFIAAGVKSGDEVVTQVLTFAATAAAIKHVGAEPTFVDVEKNTLGMSPESLERFFLKSCEKRKDGVYNKVTGRKVSAVVPMHTFGHPSRIDSILQICSRYDIQVIEDSAESLGSYYKGTHTGIFGKIGILSFNGNKPVTTGGGGMVITQDDELAERIRYLSTTAKRKHRWEFIHDDVGYNLRLPNINGAVGCAQMEYFDEILRNKRETAQLYRDFFNESNVQFIDEPKDSISNFWLNAVIFDSRQKRDGFLEYSNGNGVQTRPIWTLMSKLKPYENCFKIEVPNAEWLEDRVVNIPSGVRA